MSQEKNAATGLPAKSVITFEETLHSLLNEALIAVKATGGSVMLMDEGKVWLRIYARLGPPRHERRKEPLFRVSIGSIAGYVASTGQPYLCPNVQNDTNFAPPKLSPLHFRSLLCVPILADGPVLGVINADHEEANFFTDKDKQRLCELAQNLSFAKAIKEQQRLERILNSLHSVDTSIAHMSPDGCLSEVLQHIAEQAVNLLTADVVTLYQYDQKRQLFLVEGTGPTWAGCLFAEWAMRTQIYADDVPWKIIEQGESRYFLDSEHDDFLIGKVPARDGLPERPRFAVREGIKSLAALVLRAGREIVGIMFVNYRSNHEFTEDEKRILETFGNYAAIAIKNTRLIEELKQVQNQRLAAESWAILGKAVANLAHRIYNTVGLVPVVVQDLQGLLAQLPMREEERKLIEGDLQRIERNTRFTLELANILLKPFTGGQKKRLSINKLLKKAVALSSLPDTIKLNIILSPNVHPVTTNPLLVDVFVELISNAIKAMPNGGRLEIGTHVESENQIVIWFSDTGVGIPAEQQDKVFQLFFTSHEASLGFGLWWVKTFIVQQGGTILLQSHARQGTTVKIRLPVPHVA